MRTEQLNNTLQLNIGLDNITEGASVKGQLVKHYANHKTMTGCRIEDYQHGISNTEITAIVKLKTALPLTKVLESTRNLCKALSQKAIALKFNGEGHLVYASDELAALAEYGTAFDPKYWLEATNK